ncbi:MAG: PP2C family protein-serine/threonine phosphatase [Terriglobia bacterium]
MARFSAWVVAYGLALWLVERFTGQIPGLLWFLFWISFIPAFIYYQVRLLSFVRSRVLWRLRRRLVVAYLFIAVVPILLIILLVALGAFIMNGQLAAYLVAAKLRTAYDELKQVNRTVIHEARAANTRSPDALRERIRTFFVSELQEHSTNYPGLQITIRQGGTTRAYLLDGTPVAKPATIPSWLKREEFAGVVMDDGQIALRSVEQTKMPAGDLAIILSQPITSELLDLVGAGIGPVGVVSTRQEARAGDHPAPGLRVQTASGEFVQSGEVRSRSVAIPDPANPLDFTVLGASTLDPIAWGGDRELKLEQPIFVYVTSRVFTLNRQLLGTLGEFSRIYVIAFKGVAIVFLVIEGFALIIGIRLTRSITDTVDHLYDATERVRAGDFSYRINLRSRDQLSALGEAFDRMTASVERLLRESQEKSRLESELQIAREVQRQLFPQEIPRVGGLELYGVCNPARTVSGDYYDFIQLDENRVGLVLGDIAGKGISAALLMAAIQSSLRAQYYNGHSPLTKTDGHLPSTSEIVRRLNRQLYESTSTEKYATFFYAIYDGTSRRMAYTNAGHLPPVLFRHGGIKRLEEGGTVVGLFSPMEYEQATVELEPGDVFLAFTDGLTEPENIYGEEFGEERLLEVAQRALNCSLDVMVQEIYRSVNDWTGSPELQDDMTLIVARATR